MANFPYFPQGAILLVGAAAVAPLFSITAAQVLLTLALLALLLTRAKWEAPRIWIPLALFVLWTLASLAVSGNQVEGLKQVKKFYNFLLLPMVFTAFRTTPAVNHLILAWTAAAGAGALWSFAQYAQKTWQARQLGVDFYKYYVVSRTTGPMSHWMTFGGQQMIVLLLAAALLLFGPRGRIKRWLAAACALLGEAVVLNSTRSIVWLAVPAGALYLLWFWDKRFVFALPLLLAIALLFGPAFVRDRFVSLYRPHGETDSNQHRIVAWRTGLEMIRAHPVFGVGPQNVGAQFDRYVPADIPRPLPDGYYGHLHNVYIHYAAERGIPATLFILWFLLWALWDQWRALPAAKQPAERAVLHGTIAVILAVMVAGFFELNLGDSEVLLLFLAVLACGYRVQAGMPVPLTSSEK